MNESTRFVVSCICALAVSVTACGKKNHDANNGANSGANVGVEGEWVEVFVSSVPTNAGAERVYLLLLDSEGEVVASDDAPLVLATTLGTEVSETPLDVVVYVPNDPGWGPEQAPAEGSYAVQRAVTELPAMFNTTRWSEVDGSSEAPDDGATSVDEPQVRRTLKGGVAVQGTPTADVFVVVEGQGWAYTDSGGEFQIDALLDGPATITITGPGFSESRDLTIGSETESMAFLHEVEDVGATDDLVRHEGVITDADTGDPLEGASVMIGETEVATTDAQGAYEFDWPHQAGIRVERTDYAIYWVVPPCADVCKVDVALLPLAQEMYGKWEYCHSVEKGSSEKYVHDFELNPFPNEPQEFRDDGLAALSLWPSGLPAPWYARPSTYFDGFIFVQPIPTGPSTAYIEAPTSSVYYQFDGEYMVNYDPGPVRHYYRTEGSDVPCLAGGDGAAEGKTCEEMAEGAANAPNETSWEVLSEVVGTHEAFCTAITKSTMPCTLDDECGEEGCLVDYCQRDACADFGFECARTDNDDPSTNTSLLTTITLTENSLTIGDVTFNIDLDTSNDSPNPGEFSGTGISDGQCFDGTWGSNELVTRFEGRASLADSVKDYEIGLSYHIIWREDGSAGLTQFGIGAVTRASESYNDPSDDPPGGELWSVGCNYIVPDGGEPLPWPPE